MHLLKPNAVNQNMSLIDDFDTARRRPLYFGRNQKATSISAIFNRNDSVMLPSIFNDSAERISSKSNSKLREQVTPNFQSDKKSLFNVIRKT